MSVAEIVSATTRDRLPLHLTAWDGSSVGPESAPVSLHIAEPAGLAAFAHPHHHFALITALVKKSVTTQASPADVVESVEQLEALFVRPTPVDVVKLNRSFAALGVKRHHDGFVPALDADFWAALDISEPPLYTGVDNEVVGRSGTYVTSSLSELVAACEQRGVIVDSLQRRTDISNQLAEWSKALEPNHLDYRYRLAVLAHDLAAGTLVAYDLTVGE